MLLCKEILIVFCPTYYFLPLQKYNDVLKLQYTIIQKTNFNFFLAAMWKCENHLATNKTDDEDRLEENTL